MQGFAHPPGRHLCRWGTVRLRMTLWNVAVLALILGALGGVVRYEVQADLFATVDRTLAERAHPVIRAGWRIRGPSGKGSPTEAGSPPRVPRPPVGTRGRAGRESRAAGSGRESEGDAISANDSGGEAGHWYTIVRSYAGRKTRTTVRSRWLDPMAVAAEGSLVGSKPRALPPLPPWVIPRDPTGGPGGEPWEEPWDRHSYVRSLTGRTVYSTVRDRGTPVRVLSMPIERRGKVDRVLQLAYPLDGVLREIDELTSTLLALVPFGLLAAGLGGAFQTGRALRPVREIAGTAARLGASDLSERLITRDWIDPAAHR